MCYIRCVLRTIFYLLFFIFITSSLAIIINPSYFGIKYLIIKQSAKNIFYPTTFEEFKPELKYYSFVKLSRWNNHHIVEIIEDAFAFEYHYWCKYKYIDKNGNKGITIDHVIHNWKPWEYYYLEHNKNFITEEHKRAMSLRDEWMKNYKNPEIENYRRYQTN